MKILSFDQSSRVTGYAVFDNDKLIAFNKFKCDDPDLGVRLTQIRNMILGLIEIYQPDEVAFEDIQFQPNVADNVKTFKTLAEVFGVFQEVLNEINMDYSIVPSVTWKSALNIKGKQRAEQKRNAAEWVNQTYCIKPTQDECDAICIGAYLVKNQTKNYDWTD